MTLKKVADLGKKLVQRSTAAVPDAAAAKKLLRDTVGKGVALGQRGASGAQASAREMAASARSSAANALDGATARANVAGRRLRERGVSESAAAAAQLGSSVRAAVAGNREAVHEAIGSARTAVASGASAASKQASQSARLAVEKADPSRQARRARNWALLAIVAGAFAFGAGQATPRALADLLLALKQQGKEQ